MHILMKLFSCSAQNDADFRKKKIHLSNELNTNQSKPKKSSNHQHQTSTSGKSQPSERMQKEIDSLKTTNKQLAEKVQVNFDSNKENQDVAVIYGHLWLVFSLFLRRPLVFSL